MPNPLKDGEMITVQLVTPELTEADPDQSLRQMETPMDKYSSYSVPRSASLMSILGSQFGLQIKKRIGK